jgi:PAS domain S-box-containing protein
MKRLAGSRREPLVLLLWLLVGVILATVAALMAVVSAQGESANATSVAQGALSVVVQDMLDEETGLRGYQASGEAIFLEPYAAARASIRPHFKALAAAFDAAGLRAESPGERRTPILEQINAEWERTVADPIVSGRVPRSDPFVTVQGKVLIDRFRSVVADMQGSIQRAALENNRVVQRNILAVGAAGVAIALLVAIGLAALIRRTAALERRIEQEQQIQRLADEFPQIVWTADRAGALTWLNQAFYELTGIKPGVVPDGALWARIMHADDMARIAPLWRRTLTEGSAFDQEFRLKAIDADDAAYRWMYAVTTPVVGKDGRIERWIGSAIDIHERKTAEAALERERALLAEAMPQIVWQAVASGAATFFNSQCYAYTGLTPGEALGTGWAAAIHPADIESTLAAWQTALAKNAEYEAEYRIREGATGNYRWFLGRGNPVLRADGTVERWIGTCTDIDRQKQLESAVRESAASFERLADIVPQLIWVTDHVGNIQYTNERWREYTGAALGEIAADAGWRLVHPDDRARAAEAWGRALQAGSSYETEYRLRRHDGAYRWFLVRGRPFKDEAGEIARWFGTCTDIDLQREAHESLLTEFEREHRVSDSFQRAALPKTLPQLPGVAIHAVYRAAATETFVGGDWFDAFVLNDGRIAISVGDVMGKGLEAALTMNAVRQCIRGTARVVQYPTAVLDAVDEVIREDEPNAMVTAFLGIFSPVSRTLTYASAGHPPPIVRRRDGSVHELGGSGLPIGYRRFRARYEAAQTADLSDAALLVLYTDGLTESTRNTTDGEARVLAAIAGPGIADADNPAEALARAVLTSGTPDDVAILTLSLPAAAPPPRRIIAVNGDGEGRLLADPLPAAGT